jgi:hypothetical protein
MSISVNTWHSEGRRRRGGAGSRGQQRAAEGSRGQQRAAEGSRGQQRAAEGSRGQPSGKRRKRRKRRKRQQGGPRWASFGVRHTEPTCGRIFVACAGQDVGCRLLVVSCRLMAVGCWLMAVGCLAFAVGCWLLATAENSTHLVAPQQLAEHDQVHPFHPLARQVQPQRVDVVWVPAKRLVCAVARLRPQTQRRVCVVCEC